MINNQDDPNDIRPIPGELGYLASADGKIYSERQNQRKELAQSLVRGYLSTSIMRPGKKIGTRAYVHALVCAAFHGPRPSPVHEARHRDDNPLNACQSNLWWGTKAENVEDRRRAGTGYGGPNQRRAVAGIRNFHEGEPVPSILRSIPGYEGYLASEDGRIFSILRRGDKPPIELSTRPDDKGYPQVTLTNVCGKRSTCRKVHILVCLTFHGPRPSPEHQALHGDNDPTNPAESNLHWGLPTENMADRRAAGTLAGERSGRAKLTDVRVLEVRAHLAAGERTSDVARAYDVHPNNVKAIGEKRLWGHLPTPEGGHPAVTPAPVHERAPALGEAHGLAKLTAPQVIEIRAHLAAGEQMTDIARYYNVNPKAVLNIRSGATWSHLPNPPEGLPVVTPVPRHVRRSLPSGEAWRRAHAGTSVSMRGEASGMAKLTAAQVIEIRARMAVGERPADIGRHYGIHPNNAHTIAQKRTWDHLPDPLEGLPILEPLVRRVQTQEYGEAHHNSKLTAVRVLEIRAHLAAGERASDVARAYNLNPAVIGGIHNRTAWAHLPDPPEGYPTVEPVPVHTPRNLSGEAWRVAHGKPEN